ncbi:MAG: hypothetical protein KKE72_15640 [Gammaproteobacteria bacterium]|nr:hypothetical protein [Gammaproteobacteria bacterium]MBU2206133.1 hypothetical protein [Gammaproteobacteria bacterium]
MSTKLFRNRDVFNCILEYDTSAGPLKEVSVSSVAEKKIAKHGTYIKLDGKYYGIYATANGPCFFFQDDEFLLRDPDAVFQHESREKQHYFRFTYNDKVVIDLTYDHWDDLDIDPWSDEDFIDFFIWLTKSSGDQEFINMWTE